MPSPDKIPAAARPWRMVAPVIAFAGIFGLWSAYWLAARSYAIDAFTAHRAELAKQGFVLACAEEAWGGYPFRFEFSCAAPALGAPKGESLKGASLLAVAQAYNPRHVILLFDGPSEIVARGHGEKASHGRLIASFRLLSEGGAEASAELPGLSVEGRGSAELLQFFLRPSPEKGFDISLLGKGISHAGPGRPPLAIDRLQVTGRLAADGRLAISALELHAGDVGISGTGEVALDSLRRPTGRLDLATDNVTGLMALIEPRLHLGEQERGLVLGALSMLAMAGPVTVTAEDGVLRVGPAKVGDLLPLY